MELEYLVSGEIGEFSSSWEGEWPLPAFLDYMEILNRILCRSKGFLALAGCPRITILVHPPSNLPLSFSPSYLSPRRCTDSYTEIRVIFSK
jgi:hypothetical protein